MKYPMQRSANGRRVTVFSTAALLVVFIAALQLRADEPYARARDYDLQHSRIGLRFDLGQKKVLGDVTHSLSILRDGTAKIAFDSVGLTIQSVTVNKSPAKFETPSGKLIVPLPAPAKAGDKFEVAIHYEGKPAKGLYSTDSGSARALIRKNPRYRGWSGRTKRCRVPTCVKRSARTSARPGGVGSV